MAMCPHLHLRCCTGVLQPDVMCRILCWWVKNSVSPCIVVVTGVLQKGKASPIPTICVDSSNGELLPFPEWKGFSIVNLASSIWLFLLWDGAILGTWLGVFCWQVRHSSVTVADSVLLSGSPCFWTCPGSSAYESIVRWMAYYRMWYLRYYV